MTPPPAPAVDPDQDWLEAEAPISRHVIEDLRRLQSRARARIVTVLAVTLAITGGLMWKLIHRPAHNLAKVVLSVQEGERARRDAPAALQDLRAYVTTVLLPAKELMAMIEKRNLFPLRKKQGDRFAIDSLWDAVQLDVFRNYFLYEQNSLEAPRSARIKFTVDFSDGELAYLVAHDLASIVMKNAASERDKAADLMADDADRAVEAERTRITVLEAEATRLAALLDEAERNGETGKAAAYRVETAAAESSVRREQQALETLARNSSTDQLDAAVYRAGLSLDVTIVEDRKPEPIPPAGYRHAVIAVVLFLTILVLVSLFLGAFDPRIHDLGDVSRLGIPVVGQVPGFPGDGVGSLRARGVKRRGVPLSWR